METRKIKKEDGTIAYFMNIDGVNKLHNWDGEALIPQGNKKLAEYYLFGIKYTKEQWLDKKKDVNGIPFHKTSAGKKAEGRI